MRSSSSPRRTVTEKLSGAPTAPPAAPSSSTISRWAARRPGHAASRSPEVSSSSPSTTRAPVPSCG